jgi:hypothetical protein
VAIQAYVDDSGNNQDAYFIFSALISTAERWSAFSDAWDSCLKTQPSIRYFKMDEAAGKNGQFYRFSDSERDEKLTVLCHVINTLRPVEVSCIVDVSRQKSGWEAESKPLTEYYFFPFQVMNLQVACTVATEMESIERYEIFFDEHVIFGPRAKLWYPVLKEMADAPIRAIMPIEPLFRSDLDVSPLQAADLFAWLARQSATANGSDFPFSWVEKKLDRVLHSHMTARLPISDEGFEENEEWKIKTKAVLIAYRKAFEHDWPPKTTAEVNKIRGRV